MRHLNSGSITDDCLGALYLKHHKNEPEDRYLTLGDIFNAIHSNDTPAILSTLEKLVGQGYVKVRAREPENNLKERYALTGDGLMDMFSGDCKEIQELDKKLAEYRKNKETDQ